MKILTFSANCSYSHTSLAFPFLRAYAGLAHSADWYQVECTTKEMVEAVLDRLLSVPKPDLLFVSCYIFNREFIESVLARYRQLMPQVKIIAGGPEFLGVNQHHFNSNLYDLIIRGEGEIPFKRLLDNLLDGADIPGCCGPNYDNGFAEEVQNLDDIPSAYQSNLVDFSKPFVQIETSRGCPNSCSFCTSSITTGVRYHSLERIASDLEHLQKQGVDDIRILDRTFSCNPARAIRLLELFTSRFSEMHFHVEIDPAFITEPLYQALKDLPNGLLHVETGVQTFSADTYEQVARCSGMERTIDGLAKLCQLKNIEIHADLIAGLPGISLENLYQDLQKLIKLQPAEIQLENLKILPGTKLAKNPKIISSPLPPYEILSNDLLSYQDLQTARNWSKLIDWFYNSENLKPVIIDLNENLPNFFVEFYQFLKEKSVFKAPLSPLNKIKLLHQYLLEGGHNPENNEPLIIAWFTGGFSAEHGIFPAKMYPLDLETHYELIAGERQDRYRRTYRYGKYMIGYGKGHNNRRKLNIAVLVKT